MRHTLLFTVFSTVTCLGLALAAEPATAAGPRSRTAANEDTRFSLGTTDDVEPREGFAGDYAEESLGQPAVDIARRALGYAKEPELSDAVRPLDLGNESDPAQESQFDDVAPVIQERVLSPRMIKLRDKARATLAYYNRKHLNTRDHNPWEVMHSIVAYGVHSQLNRSGPDGAPVNAISWLCWNGDCHGTRILEANGNRLAARKGPQVQGHPGQFLAILAQSCVATNCPIKVGDQRFTLVDLIESEKLGCQAGTELTFKLISLTYYLDVDAHWTNSAGQEWSIERLVREEMSQPVIGAACGGTHRLMGLAYAVRKREESGLPMTGEFRRAKKYLDEYHRYTLTKLQNSDGSFSTEWFKAPGARPDIGRRIQTSGHILEWLSYSLPLDMLEDPRVVKTVEYLTNVLHEGEEREWEVGPLGHGLHSLAIYDSRVFKPRNEVSDRTVSTEETTTSEAAAPIVTGPLDARTPAELQVPDYELRATQPKATANATPRTTRRDPKAVPQPKRSARRPQTARP
ncbi:MAG TPA: hypothetical protein VGG64_16450 [Pirellulales bacterium]|jgi:hypothetical protein